MEVIAVEVNAFLRRQYGLGLGQVVSALTAGDEVMVSM